MKNIMRLFLSIEIPENIQKVLRERAEDLAEAGLFEGKITELENIHLTLKFLGEVEEEKLPEIVERLKNLNIPQYNGIIGGLGVFDEKYIKIIWAKLLGIDELQKTIDYALEGLFQKEERFMSHITLARVKNVREKRSLIDAVKNIRLENLEFPILGFTLMRS